MTDAIRAALAAHSPGTQRAHYGHAFEVVGEPDVLVRDNGAMVVRWQGRSLDMLHGTAYDGAWYTTYIGHHP